MRAGSSEFAFSRLRRSDAPKSRWLRSAEDLRTAPADLTTIALRRRGVFPDVEIREIVDGRRRLRGHGPQNMPLWGKAFGMSVASAGGQHESETRDKIVSLVDYLKAIQRK